MPGAIVILNGAPRAGKSSIVTAVMTGIPGNWINLGVDQMMPRLPDALKPGIGLRPGGERPDLEADVVRLYRELYDDIGAQARAGRDVIVDVGHHDWYSRPLGILTRSARQLEGLPVLFVGVRCPIDVIMARRNADPHGGFYATGEGIPEPVQRWQDAVHDPGIYDLEVDTSLQSPEACAAVIAGALAGPPAVTAFERLATQ
ncbi:MAG TPA: chloramphenicol phosphotransferase [Devosia sp.]